MGFAERNSVGGRLAQIAFPDAIRRNSSSNTATVMELQITNTSGSPQQPDNGLVYIRVVDSTGTAVADVLKTASNLTTALTDSASSDYPAGSEWHQVATTAGKVSIFHKTGSAESVEGIYTIELAWLQTDEPTETARAFRIVDAADIDAILVDTGTTLPGLIGSPAADLAADIAAVKTDTAAILVDTSATLDNLIDTEVAAILDDTGTTIPGTISTLTTNVATVDGIVDDILVDTAEIGSAVGASISADIAAVKTVADAIPTTAMRGTDSAALATVLGALTATAVGVAANNDDTAMSLLKGILTDTLEIGDAVGASISADIAAVKTDTAAILIDTSATLDDLIDTEVAAILTDTGTTIPTLIGTPAANLAADIAAVKTDTAAILVDTGATLDNLIDTEIADILTDTGTTIPGTISTLTTNVATVDTVVDAIKAVTDVLPNSGALTDLATASAVSTLQTAVTSIQNNTRFVATVPAKLNRESAAVAVKCFLYDSSGNMEDADSNEVFVKISQMDGDAIASRYYSNSSLVTAISAEGSGTFSGYYPLSRTAPGLYSFFYKNDASHAEENLTVEFGWEEGSAARYQSRAMQISDAADLDTIAANLVTVDTVVDGIQTDLSNGTDGLGALKTLIDTVNTDLSNGSDGLGAIKTETAAILLDTAEIGSAVGASISADIAAVKTVADAIPTTAMRGTDSAALATVLGALNATAVGVAANNDDTAMSLLKGILTDTLEIGDAVGASISADIAAVKTDTTAILTDTGTTLNNLIDSEIADILTDTGSTIPATITTLTTNVGTVDTVVDAIQVDLGNFSGNTNLQSSLAVLGTGFESANLSLSSTQLMANSGVRLYAISSYSVVSTGPLKATFVLGNVTGGHDPLGSDGYYSGGIFVSVEDGKQISCTGYTGSSRTVAFTDYGSPTTSLANGDLVAFFADAGFIGSSADAAASSSSDANKSVFARLRYIAGVVEGLATPGGAHHGTFTKYLMGGAGDNTLLTGDPTDPKINAATTTTSNSFVILSIAHFTMDEGTKATFDDIFAILKWHHQGTASTDNGTITTKWMISAGTETVNSAPSGDAENITGDVAGTTSATVSTVSGLVTDDGVTALNAGSGVVKFLLVGKANTSGDTCTCKIYKSTSAEVTYHVT